MFEVIVLLQHWSFIDVIVGGDAMSVRVVRQFPDVIGVITANVDVEED